MKTNEKRLVYRTETNKWYLVDKSDRDYIYAIPESRFNKIGEKKAREEYLGISPIIIRDKELKPKRTRKKKQIKF